MKLKLSAGSIAFIILMMIVLTISLVSSAPTPFIQSSSAVGLDVAYRPIDTLKLGEEYRVNVHVFNKTDSHLITNSTGICFYHLYNRTGWDIDDSKMEGDINKLDFVRTITKENFSYAGVYSIIIQCNTTDGATGYATGYFTVSQTGKTAETGTSLLYLGLGGVMILMFFLVVFGIPMLPQKYNKNDEDNIVSINNLAYLRPVLYGVAWFLLIAIVFMSSNIALAYLPSKMIGDFLFVVYRVMFMITLPMIVIWLVYMIASILKDAQFKKMIERGIDVERI